MKKIALATALFMAPVLAQAWPWSKDMSEQISVKPQESVDPSHPGMALYPEHSIPAPGTTVYYKDRPTTEKLAKNPIAPDQKSLELGGKLFGIYCTPCHGYEGKGDGLVGQKLMLKPFDLTSAMTKGRTDAYIYAQMTYGGAVMPSYANDLSPSERWDVVNYVRKVLQQGAKVYSNVNGR